MVSLLNVLLPLKIRCFKNVNKMYYVSRFQTVIIVALFAIYITQSFQNQALSVLLLKPARQNVF